MAGLVKGGVCCANTQFGCVMCVGMDLVPDDLLIGSLLVKRIPPPRRHRLHVRRRGRVWMIDVGNELGQGQDSVFFFFGV